MSPRLAIGLALLGAVASLLSGVPQELVKGWFQDSTGPNAASAASSSPTTGGSSTAPGTGGEGNKASTPATDGSEGSGLSPAQRDLADRVEGTDLSGCHGAETGSYAAAAINCKSAKGPEQEPLALSFDNADDLSTWLAGVRSLFTVSDTAADCEPDKNYASTWSQDGAETGTLTCYWKDGIYRMAWSFDDQLIAVVANDSNAANLIAWWRTGPVNP